MFNKKGQGLSINVIIVAVIALIILILLFVMVASRTKIFGSGLDSEQDFVESCICNSIEHGSYCGESQGGGGAVRAVPIACGEWIDCQAPPNGCYIRG
tara:strand:- start:18466 stop:18759 length:294 start_codon:yes stop_codon:yes gene_type:complete